MYQSYFRFVYFQHVETSSILCFRKFITLVIFLTQKTGVFCRTRLHIVMLCSGKLEITFVSGVPCVVVKDTCPKRPSKPALTGPEPGQCYWHRPGSGQIKAGYGMCTGISWERLFIFLLFNLVHLTFYITLIKIAQYCMPDYSKWCHMTRKILVNNGSDNDGLLPGSTKLLAEPILAMLTMLIIYIYIYIYMIYMHHGTMSCKTI